MIVKRRVKALEDSTPKIKKNAIAIKKQCPKKKKSSKNESETMNMKNLQKKILLKKESKDSKELEARIAEAIFIAILYAIITSYMQFYMQFLNQELHLIQKATV